MGRGGFGGGAGPSELCLEPSIGDTVPSPVIPDSCTSSSDMSRGCAVVGDSAPESVTLLCAVEPQASASAQALSPLTSSSSGEVDHIYRICGSRHRRSLLWLPLARAECC